MSRPTGFDQAIKTGEFLREKLEEDPDIAVDLTQSEIYLFSSPFLTCVETSTAIIKGLSKSKIYSISVQD